MPTVQRTLALPCLPDLLSILSELDFAWLKTLHFPGFKVRSGLRSGKEDRLNYASLYLLDTSVDCLMHIKLTHFHTFLIKSFPCGFFRRVDIGVGVLLACPWTT